MSTLTKVERSALEKKIRRTVCLRGDGSAVRHAVRGCRGERGLLDVAELNDKIALDGKRRLRERELVARGRGELPGASEHLVEVGLDRPVVDELEVVPVQLEDINSSVALGLLLPEGGSGDKLVADSKASRLRGNDNDGLPDGNRRLATGS